MSRRIDVLPLIPVWGGRNVFPHVMSYSFNSISHLTAFHMWFQFQTILFDVKFHEINSICLCQRWMPYPLIYSTPCHSLCWSTLVIHLCDCFNCKFTVVPDCCDELFNWNTTPHLFLQNVMAENRVALSAMLSQLLEEKDRRQTELKKILVNLTPLLCYI